MPRIVWTNLPTPLLWRESDPEAPDGPWYKDFGSFKVCGEGQYPKTFLLPGQTAQGQKLR